MHLFLFHSLTLKISFHLLRTGFTNTSSLLIPLDSSLKNRTITKKTQYFSSYCRTFYVCTAYKTEEQASTRHNPLKRLRGTTAESLVFFSPALMHSRDKIFWHCNLINNEGEKKTVKWRELKKERTHHNLVRSVFSTDSKCSMLLRQHVSLSELLQSLKGLHPLGCPPQECISSAGDLTSWPQWITPVLNAEVFKEREISEQINIT